MARHERSAVVGPGDCEGFGVNVQPAGGLLEFLQRVPNPRGRLGWRHSLSDKLAVLVCATLCGFRGIRLVVHWLELHGAGMWHLLGFRRKPPVRQTFANVQAEIDPDLLDAVLLEFVEQEADDLVTIKGNPPQLLHDIEQAFVIPRSFSPLRRT